MDVNFSVLFLYVLFILTTGANVLFIVFPNVVRKNNVFINSGAALTVGSFIIILLLYVMAFFNKLSLITLSNTLPFFILSTLFFVVLLINNIRQHRINFLNLLVALVLFIFFIPLMKDSLYSYLIGWDAIAIWMLKAKVFFYESGIWSNRYYLRPDVLAYSHKAYPIGFPLLVASYYRLIGEVNDQLAQFFYLIYYLGIVYTFYGFIRKIFSKFSHIGGLLLTLSIFIIPNVITYSHNGYMDVPLAFTFLMTTILFICIVETGDIKEKFSYFVLFLISASLGAVFKNEGLTYFVFSIVTGGLYTIMTYKKSQNVSNKYLLVVLLTLVISLLPIILWEYAKFSYNLEADSYIANLHIYANSLSRVKIIVFYYIDEILKTAKYGILLIPFVFLSVLEVTTFILRKKVNLFLFMTPLALQFGVYTLIYFITSVPLLWQLQTSFERLLLHLLPSFFVLVIYFVKPVTQEVAKLFKKFNIE